MKLVRRISVDGALFLAASTIWACSGGAGGTTGDEQDVQSQDRATSGEACGTDVAIHKPCAAGLTCVSPTGAPIDERTHGICVPKAEHTAFANEGHACRSFGNPTLPQCKAGLICVPGPIPDTAHCEKAQTFAKDGDACKSFGNPTLPACEAGLICVPGPIPDTAHCAHPGNR